MPADVSVWTPNVEHRRHPYGERGVFSSLEEVCKRANQGAVSPKVRMWAIECLDRARKERGLKMNTEKQRAEVLLKAVQQKLWVPDPVGTEWMAGAHLMACDPKKDGVCFRGGDCDDATILLAACFISCGLYSCIVGHAYDKKKQIQHVLTTVYAGGRWYYADPSTDLALGECVTFSRERVYSLPNVQMLCDDSVCFTNPRVFIPEKNNFVVKGDFVGVNGVPGNGVPDFAWIVDSAMTHDGQMLGMVGQEQGGGVAVEVEASDQIYGDTQKAAIKEAKKMQWPPSDEQVENVAAVAGGSAAAIACSVAGAPVASPVCGKIGAEISRFVTDKVIDGLKKIFVRRNAKAWREYHTRRAQSETLFAGADLAFEYARVQGEALTQIVDSLEALHVDFYGASSGSNRNDWRRALAFVGAPISERPGLVAPDGKPEFNFTLNVHQEWRDFFEQIRPALTTDSRGKPVFGDFAQEQIKIFFADLGQRIDDDVETAGKAANLLATKMSADAVSTKAAEAVGVPMKFRLREASRSSSSSGGRGWLVAAAVAGGVAWWLWG